MYTFQILILKLSIYFIVFFCILKKKKLINIIFNSIIIYKLLIQYYVTFIPIFYKFINF